MHVKKWRQGKILLTQLTKRWTHNVLERQKAVEQQHIYTDFHESDEGRSRQLVCKVNELHPDFEFNRRLIEKAPDLLTYAQDVGPHLSGEQLEEMRIAINRIVEYIETGKPV